MRADQSLLPFTRSQRNRNSAALSAGCWAWQCCWMGHASRFVGTVRFRLNPAPVRTFAHAELDHVSPSSNAISDRSSGAVRVQCISTSWTMRFFVLVGMALLDRQLGRVRRADRLRRVE